MIVAETLKQIVDAASTARGLNEDLLSSLKESWPQLRFTFCNDEDMPARMPPVLRSERFNLYLLGGGEHCLSLTEDPGRAIGVVLALVDEED